jgi:hypothetical protein
MGDFTLDGKSVHPRDFLDDNNPAYYGLNHLGYNGGDHAMAIKDLHNEAKLMYQNAQRYPVGDQYRTEFLQSAKEYLDGAKWLKENKDRLGYTPPPPQNPGNLYQVAIRPDAHELLDWDRPLAEQHPQVRAALAGKAFDDLDTGAKIYNQLANGLQGGPAAASRVLHDAGIPGVRFQDAGSRGLPPGHPDETHNYVIFHHQNLKVIDKNGQHFGLEPVEGDPWVAPKARSKP